jgi:type VI protein secretion system component VasK
MKDKGSRDKIIGLGIFVVGIFILVLYTYMAILVPAGWDPLGLVSDFENLMYWIIIIPLWLICAGMLAIFIWLGWSTLRTPPAKIVEQELKEIAELEKKSSANKEKAQQ